MLRQIATDLLPGLAKIRRLVDERIAIVHEVKIDADVRRAGIEVRRSNAGDRSPGRESRDILGDVDPLPAVVRVPNLAIIRSCPDEAFFYFGWSNSKDNFSVELAEIVSYDSS